MSDLINLPAMTIPQLQELITGSVKAALAAWTPPQVPPSEEKKFLSRKDLCDQFGIAYPTLDRLVKTGVLQTYRPKTEGGEKVKRLKGEEANGFQTSGLYFISPLINLH